jgi:hypothetical protein
MTRSGMRETSASATPELWEWDSDLQGKMGRAEGLTRRVVSAAFVGSSNRPLLGLRRSHDASRTAVTGSCRYWHAWAAT